MKKIKLFDRGVFQEGFRHLKVPGILFLIVYSLPIIIDFISSLTSKKASTSLTGLISDSNLAYTALSLSFFGILLLVIFILVAPILTISAFSFLTKRNASDIYHSLPFKRETIFTSLFTAVAAWLGIISIGSSLLSLVSSLIINSSSVAFSNWILSALASFISLLFVAACFAIAVTITGTLGSNIVVGFLITYLPRLVINSITQAIISSLPILTSEHLSFFMKNQYNLLTSSYDTYFLITRRYSSLYAPSIYACIYTLVVSLIYIVLACILFRRRKSESAAQSAPNRTLQAVYRIALCMVICIFVLTALFNNITKGDIVTALRSLIWYIVAIVVYFAYELITTRRFKNLLKALPGLGVVVVVNLAIYGIMAGVRSYELNFTPAKEDISSVSVSMQNVNLTPSQYYDSYNYYADNKTIDIDLDDENAISIVADSLKKNVDALKVSKTKYSNIFRSGNDSSNGYQSTTVKIKTNFGTKYRRIFISTPDLAKIKNIYYNKNEYREMYKKLPKANSGSISINMGGLSNLQLPAKTLDDIVEKVREEIAECDFELLYEKLNAEKSSDITLYYRHNADRYSYSIKIPLRPDITPKTYEMLLEEYYSQTAENRNEIREILKKYISTYNISVRFFNGEKLITSYYDMSKTAASLIVNNEKEGAPKVGDTFVIITLTKRSSEDSYMTEQIDAIINLGDIDEKSIFNAYAYYT